MKKQPAQRSSEERTPGLLGRIRSSTGGNGQDPLQLATLSRMRGDMYHKRPLMDFPVVRYMVYGAVAGSLVVFGAMGFAKLCYQRGVDSAKNKIEDQQKALGNKDGQITALKERLIAEIKIAEEGFGRIEQTAKEINEAARHAQWEKFNKKRLELEDIARTQKEDSSKKLAELEAKPESK